MNIRRTAIVFVISLVSPLAAVAQSVGDKVVVITEKAEIKNSNGMVTETTHAGAVFVVREVQSESLGIQGVHGTGFLEKRHVIPLSRAVSHWSDIIGKEADDASAYIARGLAHRELRDYDKAIADYTEALRIAPKSSAAYLNRGSVWMRKQEYDKAIEDFTQAIGLNPNYSGAYTNRGAAWQAKGDHDKAIANFKEAIRLDPKDPANYFNRGNACRNNGNLAEAVLDYSQAIQIDPQFVAAFLNRGQSLADRADYQGALGDFNEAIRIDPNYARAFERRAWLWSTCPNDRIRDGNRAVVSALHACELDRGKTLSFIATLAAAYAEAGDFDKAIRFQSKIVHLVPESEKPSHQQRLELFRKQSPYRDVPVTTKQDPTQ